ncbi:MAG: helix-hairpin-helix domain-containing protein [Clostridiales Family XIII bacterium]|nr:helix-hairpin-helix domain-containing protein [Clostridiales Family XIII bacterium]
MKNRKMMKFIFIIAAVAGIVAVTYLDRSADEGEADVLYADGAYQDASSGAVDDGGVASEAAPADGVIVEAASASPGAVSGPLTIFVDVSGAVKSPAVYELGEGSRVYEAIEAAGGLTKDADITYLNRAAALIDGDRVYIPTKDEIESSEQLPASAGFTGGSSGAQQDAGGGATGASAGGAAGTAQVNINTADTATLQTLNGVGPATAQKIIDYRDGNGSFANIEDLKKVSGIGEKTFEKLKDHICV